MIQRDQKLPLSKQVALLLDVLKKTKESGQLDSHSSQFANVMEYLRELPRHQRPETLLVAAAEAFKTTVEYVKEQLTPKSVVKDFEELVPKTGWLRDYVCLLYTSPSPRD